MAVAVAAVAAALAVTFTPLRVTAPSDMRRARARGEGGQEGSAATREMPVLSRAGRCGVLDGLNLVA